MPSGGSRRGRRDNGLVAAEYAAVGDVDPRVGEHLLDVLAGEGIAAYLLPATDLHPVTRTTTLPARPTDRLYADREHVGTAKMYLAQLRGEPAGADREDVDLDAAWASIVAGYDAEVDAAAPPWPAAENVADRRHDDTDPDLRLDGLEWEDRDDRDRERPRRDSDARGPDDVSEPPLAATVHPARGDVDEPSLLDALDTFGANLPADDEGRFTPPPAPPVPRPPVPVVLALVGIAVGLLLFFQPNLAPIDEDLALLLGFGLLLAGVVALVWRLRPGGEEDDDDPDDGAVV